MFFKRSKKFICLIHSPLKLNPFFLTKVMGDIFLLGVIVMTFTYYVQIFSSIQDWGHSFWKTSYYRVDDVLKGLILVPTSLFILFWKGIFLVLIPTMVLFLPSSLMTLVAIIRTSLFKFLVDTMWCGLGKFNFIPCWSQNDLKGRDNFIRPRFYLVMFSSITCIRCSLPIPL